MFKSLESQKISDLMCQLDDDSNSWTASFVDLQHLVASKPLLLLLPFTKSLR